MSHPDGPRPVTAGGELRDIVHAKVAEVLGVSLAEISDSTDLRADYSIDSIELLEIGARVEQELSLRIKVEDLAQAETVGHAVELLGARLAGDEATR
ncbi:MAG: acyl carrier protein [Frankia sp.]